MTTPTQRYLPGLVLGAQVYFVPNGTSIDTTLSSSLIAPELPAAAAIDSGVWLSMGKILTATPEFMNKEVDIEGCDDSLDASSVHSYNKETITMQDKKNYKFSTRYLSPEAFELSHALLASDARPYIEGWLYARHIDTLADAGAQILTEVCIYGRLKLTSSIGASSDATQAEYQFDIVKNALASASLDALHARLA